MDGEFYDMISEYVEQNIKKIGPQHLSEIAFGASAGRCVTERMQSAVEKVALEFVGKADMRVSPSSILSFLLEIGFLCLCCHAAWLMCQLTAGLLSEQHHSELG